MLSISKRIILITDWGSNQQIQSLLQVVLDCLLSDALGFFSRVIILAWIGLFACPCFGFLFLDFYQHGPSWDSVAKFGKCGDKSDWGLEGSKS